MILQNAMRNLIPLNMTFYGENNLACIGIAAQKREYRFAQNIGLAIKKQMERRYSQA